MNYHYTTDVTRESFKTFCDILGFEVNESHGGGLYAIQEKQDASQTIEFVELDEGPIIHTTYDGYEPHLSVHTEVPAEDCVVGQDVDDHQLFTALARETLEGADLVVSQWGPPARFAGGAIELEGADPESYLLRERVE